MQWNEKSDSSHPYMVYLLSDGQLDNKQRITKCMYNYKLWLVIGRKWASVCQLRTEGPELE